MKCNKCGFENKDTAKFCSRCGESLEIVDSPQEPQVTAQNNNSTIIVIALLVIIIILVGAIGFFVLNNTNSPTQSESSQVDAGSDSSDDSDDDSSSQTTPTDKKEWKLIGSYSGSGSGSQSISVPPGKIMIKITAYPIKNYATNHLYVTGSNSEFVGVDWGSSSPVESRSDSITITTTSTEIFVIDYFETVSWQVDFYRYE